MIEWSQWKLSTTRGHNIIHPISDHDDYKNGLYNGNRRKSQLASEFSAVHIMISVTRCVLFKLNYSCIHPLTRLPV